MGRTVRVLIALFSMCAISVSLSAAALVPKVSSEIVHGDMQNTEVLVGQSLVVRVKILVPTWFTKPVYFDEVEALNLISLSLDKSSYPTSERVGGDTWSGIIKEYTLIPMTGGNYTVVLPALTLHYMGDNNQAEKLQVTPDPVTFSATIPAAAASLEPLIIASDITLTQQLDVGESVVVGQSFNRQITAEISGTSALFLPPLLADIKSNSVQNYLQSPKVNDAVDSRTAQITGTRIDAQELVVIAPGVFALPDVTLRFYDPETAEVRSVSVAGQSFNVTGNPETRGWLIPLLSTVAGLLLLGLGYRWLRPGWQAYRRSEPVKFRRLLSRSRSVDRDFIVELEHWHRHWLDVYHASPEVLADYQALVLEAEATVYLAVPLAAPLNAKLQQHRKKLRASKSPYKHQLMPLNP